LGQHFLVDRQATARIVRALEIAPGDPLLEIGPGRGALTASLIEAAGRIAAVEIDRHLAADLRGRFEESRLHLVVGDVLGLDLHRLLRELGSCEARLVVAGNLPYEVSKPIVQKLIRERESVDRAVLMFQREVAERLTAPPGGRRFGPITVLAGLCYEIEILFHLAPRAFHPPPKVESSVTRWRRRSDLRLDGELENRLRRVLAHCFARRRRTLRNNLRAALLDDTQVDQLLERVGLDGTRRAETLSPQAFLRLAASFPLSGRADDSL
jgi:16S rRNA (adenine1518-N6/adenine1519-N6)-dimethyltransferase